MVVKNVRKSSKEEKTSIYRALIIQLEKERKKLRS